MRVLPSWILLVAIRARASERVRRKTSIVLVGFGSCSSFPDVAGEVDLHPLAEEAGAGEVLGQQSPAFGAIAGLFDQLALGRGERSFVGFDAAGRKFDKEAAGGVAVLALEDDLGIVRVLRLIDGEDDDGAVVANDVAGVDTCRPALRPCR